VYVLGVNQTDRYTLEFLQHARPAVSIASPRGDAPAHIDIATMILWFSLSRRLQSP